MKQTPLQLSTSCVELPVKRDGKAVGTLRFDPSDTLFLARFYALGSKLEAHRTAFAATLETAAVPQDGFACLATLWQAVCCDLDEVFGTGTAAMVFGESQNLGLLQQFFTGVGTVLEQSRAPKLAAYTEPQGSLQ